MKEYQSVVEFAQKFGLPVRTVRHYCQTGQIEGCVLTGKTWRIPLSACPPVRQNRRSQRQALLHILREEKSVGLRGGIYHRVQIDLTYNSNHIEGSRLTEEQTRHIFETHTVGVASESVNVDDIIETVNHFRCIDYVIDTAEKPLSATYIKHLHSLLKSGTTMAQKDWFAVGDYKRLPNEVGGRETAAPEEVASQMDALLHSYRDEKRRSLDALIDFHVKFERIHPFQDGNGRVGRLILFKECLAAGFVPFIITDDLKAFYYRGLSQWGRVNGYLSDTCLTAQDRFKALLTYFRIPF